MTSATHCTACLVYPLAIPRALRDKLGTVDSWTLVDANEHDSCG